ncbi:MAG TPA: glycosyltransferase N-terminal domain-containing protein [Bacteroidota bacterium]|nr:glycosyltransferase N-terminal domain-containing protein [Bacteroidota bacterium]
MRTFWYILYNVLVIPFLWVSLRLLALVKQKVRRGIAGRRHLFEQLEREMKRLQGRKRVWVHSSSLGEFEQAKPIIAALRKRYPHLEIIVSFFSPSGYDNSRTYKLASLITYIPFDTPRNARRFLDLIRPDVAIMVRYDLWPNHIWELKRRNIPTLLANATLRPDSSRFWFALRNFHHYLYNDLTAILAVSPADVEAFRRFHLTKPQLQAIGETRYDQVWQRSLEAKEKHFIPSSLLRRRHVVVVGSSWEEDEAVVLPVFRKIVEHDSSALMILVPHEPTMATLERLELSLNTHLRSIRFSALNDYANEHVIIVDSIGILMALYQYADVAYVGGSFKQGVHNVLEPAAYGVPVLFGPRHENSHEAKELIQRGGGFVVVDQQDCYRTLRKLLNDSRARMRAGNIALQLVKENIGATERIVEQLARLL